MNEQNMPLSSMTIGRAIKNDILKAPFAWCLCFSSLGTFSKTLDSGYFFLDS
jgi:hypothetical protein